MNKRSTAKLILQDGTVFSGCSIGAQKNTSGEVVFNTGMVGYPESMTDPSYKDQILVFTYPLIGNYGIPESYTQNGVERNFESSRIHLKAIITSEYSPDHSHWTASRSLHDWMCEHEVAGITGIDTRALTRKLREEGVMLGKIVIDQEPGLYDPNTHNLVQKVSVDEPVTYGEGKRKVILLDCGCKNTIIHNLLKRDVRVKKVPWDYDFAQEEHDGVFISNGPGDPSMCKETVRNVKKALANRKPVFGVCFGNQVLALAAGARTFKLKYGHRSQNQPCIDLFTKRCYITSQNHGYAVNAKSLPDGWKEWFVNANDSTNEGIIHERLPFMSVQFHPEATPGPTDTNFLFDTFTDMLRR